MCRNSTVSLVKPTLYRAVQFFAVTHLMCNGVSLPNQIQRRTVMNHTKNYNLPQWELGDLIRMEDFNGMCASIENGLTSSKAAAEADAAETRAIANSAKVTANAAQAAAAVKPYVVGSYVGNGGEQVIHLGFRPSFLIVSGMQRSVNPNSMDSFLPFFGMTGGNALERRIALLDNGFVVYPADSSHSFTPHYNAVDRVYDYIAFK